MIAVGLTDFSIGPPHVNLAQEHVKKWTRTNLAVMFYCNYTVQLRLSVGKTLYMTS